MYIYNMNVCVDFAVLMRIILSKAWMMQGLPTLVVCTCMCILALHVITWCTMMWCTNSFPLFLKFSSVFCMYCTVNSIPIHFAWQHHRTLKLMHSVLLHFRCFFLLFSAHTRLFSITWTQNHSVQCIFFSISIVWPVGWWMASYFLFWFYFPHWNCIKIESILHVLHLLQLASFQLFVYLLSSTRNL